LLQVRDLDLFYGDAQALGGVSLEVAAGEIVALTGPSGCGKTTLLRCINGLERADAGTIRVDGNQVPTGAGGAAHGAGDPALLAIRRRVGFVFQTWNLFAHRTVLDNVIEAPVHVAKVPVAEATARAHALLERVGIAARAAAQPHQLSGGEQQRAAIARALAMNPTALLLDEPTSALDPGRRRELAALLRGLVDEGLALLCVSHDPDFARELRARVLVMVGGRIASASP
jgi:polar amino acid transport system ATP-binding protein